MSTACLIRELHGQPIYWTGRVRDDDQKPIWSPWRADAYKFHDARAAVECANTHRRLADSEHWRVELLDAGCERVNGKVST